MTDKTILTQLQAKVVKFINRARLTKDPARPVLAQVSIRPKDGYAGTADGFRMHAVPASDFPVQVDSEFTGLPVGRLTTGSEYSLERPDDEGTCRYPDLDAIVPNTQIAFEIACDPKLLADALRELSGVVLLRFVTGKDGKSSPNHPFEVLGTIEHKQESVPTYALIMPIFKDTADERLGTNPFRPGRNKAK